MLKYFIPLVPVPKCTISSTGIAALFSSHIPYSPCLQIYTDKCILSPYKKYPTFHTLFCTLCL